MFRKPSGDSRGQHSPITHWKTLNMHATRESIPKEGRWLQAESVHRGQGPGRKPDPCPSCEVLCTAGTSSGLKMLSYRVLCARFDCRLRQLVDLPLMPMDTDGRSEVAQTFRAAPQNGLWPAMRSNAPSEAQTKLCTGPSLRLTDPLVHLKAFRVLHLQRTGRPRSCGQQTIQTP